MTEPSSSIRKRGYLPAAVLIGPVFLYPCFYLVVFAFDSFAGDRIILNRLIHFSKREIWDLFWVDWLASLPAAFVVGLPLLCLALFIQQKSRYRITIALPMLAIVVSIAISLIIFGGSYSATLPATALLFAVPAGWILKKCQSG